MPFLLGFASAIFAVVLGVAAVIRRRRSVPSWCFLGGMVVLAAEAILVALVQNVVDPVRAGTLLTLALGAKALLPGFWICFSLTYSRGNAGEFLRGWRWLLAASVLVPVATVIWFHSDLLSIEVSESRAVWWVRSGEPARALSVMVLLAAVLVLVNLERTARAAIGTARWRIKYLFLGVGLIFGVKIYTLSQALLFSEFNPSLAVIETVALLIACVLISVAYLREGFGEIDLYPSHAVLRGSLTVFLAGCYLLVVGLLAQVVAMLGGTAGFPAQAFLVLVGVVGLATLLLSARVRSGVQRFVARNFRRPQHDFRQVWTRFTQRTSNVMNRGDLCRAATKLISETFDALTVSLFLVDEEQGQLVRSVSTYEGESVGDERGEGIALDPETAEYLRQQESSFDLRDAEGSWVDRLREASPAQFSHGGIRRAVPLVSGSRLLGVVVLADRVNGMPYTQEERDLLKCIADQFAAALLARHLTDELVQVRELEAFQTMSTFFVHDLKNAANSLNLMLQNLPNHFDDPQFRKDALRAVGKSVGRINELVIKLSALRGNLELHPVPADLKGLIGEALEDMDEVLREVEVEKRFGVTEGVRLDPDRMRSVVINLLGNAREAIEGQGMIRIETRKENGLAVLEVEDTGCGMAPEFVRDSLWRPFRSTKSKGLGIGLFQSKMIVEAHRGTIQVESEPGRGTTFRVLLPMVGS